MAPHDYSPNYGIPRPEAVSDGLVKYLDRLLHEKIKVADLSEFLGFTEPSSFVRSFKGWTGDTPKAYRERMSALGPRKG